MMNRDALFTAKIAFRLPQSLHDKLTRWAEQDDRPLANLIYTLVRQAVTEHDQEMQTAKMHKETN